MSLFDAPEYASYIQLCRELRLMPDHNPEARAISGGPTGRFLERDGELVADGPSGVGAGDYFIYREPNQVPDGCEGSFRWKHLHERPAGIVYGEWSEPLIAQDMTGASIAIPEHYELYDYVWLPRLDQWLDMLEDDPDGCDVVTFRKSMKMDEPKARYIGVVYSAVSSNRPDIERRYWPTREEAAARLWMAVTNRSTVTS